MEKLTESRVEKAVELFRSGYGCAQSIVATYADLFGMDREQALRLASSFGGGLGGSRQQLCGTVSGMALLAGLVNGTVDPGDREGKKANFDTVKLLTEEFRSENGSVNCGQLLGLQPGLPEGMKKKPCVEYVRYAATLVEKHLLK